MADILGADILGTDKLLMQRVAALPRRPLFQQSGVALITVLLIVFLASMAAVNLTTMQHMALRRTTLLQHQQQARLHTLGAEQWALLLLQRDQLHSSNDHLQEAWALLPTSIALEHGMVSGKLRDLQGCFNLNNLWSDEPATDSSTDAPQLASNQPPRNRSQMQVLQRLLTALDIDSGLAEAIADWIDSDTVPRRADGAEDSVYQRLDPPYLSANQPFSSVSELRLVQGVSAEVYQRLAPLVCTLPPGTTLNVNTAPTMLLAALVADTDRATLEQLLRTPPAAGYQNVDEFLNAAHLTPDAATKALLGVASQYFELQVSAQVGEGRAQLRSTMFRDGGQVRILSRNFANHE